MLLFSRRSFYRLSFFSAPDLKWSMAILAAVGAVIWWGFFAYRHVEYANDLWWTFAFDSAAPRFLRAAAGMSFAALLIFLLLWLRPSRPAIAQPSAAEVKALVAGSYASDAALALLGDKKFFMSQDRKSAVIYSPAGSFWISMGDPIGKRRAWPSLSGTSVKRRTAAAQTPPFTRLAVNGLKFTATPDLTPRRSAKTPAWISPRSPARWTGRGGERSAA